ncbi:MAG: FecR domain-containing protein [Elusimicrobia bacterium]|nr:FecR domain-containing protein [Elusimicrobiota bacterium]
MKNRKFGVRSSEFIVRRILLILLLTMNYELSTINCLHSAQMAGVITTIKEDVHVLPYQKNIWQPSKVGAFLYEGDTVKTLKNSQAAITLTNGVVIKLNQNTEFSFDVNSSIEKISSQIKMKAGQIWSKVRPKTKFEIHTPVAIVAVRGTEFDVNYGAGKLKLKVYKGMVNLKNKFGNVNVKEGKEASAGDEGVPEPPKDSEGEEKKWDDEIVSKGSLKIETKTAKPVTDKAFEIAVSVYDADNKLDKTAKPEITIKSDIAEMSFSSDGANWINELKTEGVSEGVIKLFAKTSAAGVSSIIASSDGYTAGQISITAIPAKTKNLKVKVTSSTGDDELLLKFKKK